MKRGFQPIGERPGGTRVLKMVKLSDGREIEFEVFVINSPASNLMACGVQPKAPLGGYGRVPRRGAS